MTHEDEFIGRVEAYLDEYEGLTPLPDAVRDTIRTELPKTRQLGSQGPKRFLSWTMSTPAPIRYGLVAAVVVAGAVLGGGLVSRYGINFGGPPATATPTATPLPPPLAAGITGPGPYRTTGAEVNGTFTVPAGWSNFDGWGVAKGEGNAFLAVMVWPVDAEVATVYADSCDWSGNVVSPPVGPAVDDLANALAAQPDRGDAAPIDATIDGYDGKLVEMTVPSDIVLADCDLGEFRSWNGRWHQGPDQVDDVYVLDVSGQRVTVIATYMPGTSAAERAEQQAILESLDLAPR